MTLLSVFAQLQNWIIITSCGHMDALDSMGQGPILKGKGENHSGTFLDVSL